MTVTFICARVSRNETLTYEIDGEVDASCAYDLIASGEYEPVESKIHMEDIDIVEVRVVSS